MECLAVFLDRLKSAEDDLNGGNLLDHTTVLVGSGLANGSSHSTRDMPILVAGGGFKHGTHKKYLEQSGKRVPLNNLYLNLLHRFGVETDRFNTSTGSLTNFS